MTTVNELMELGLAFHGHCPAMPLGLRAALAAMKTLGVEKAQDKELQVISETGKGHAAGCFLDGIMVATGCTYGKSNKLVETDQGLACGGCRTTGTE